MDKVQVHVCYWPEDAAEPRFLLLRRPAEKNFLWQPVTGKIEAGESPEDAAVREVREETGLDLSGKLYKVGLVTFAKDGKTIREGVFWGRSDSTRVELSSEHIEYAWVSGSEAGKRLFYGTNREGLARVLEEIGKQ